MLRISFFKIHDKKLQRSNKKVLQSCSRNQRTLSVGLIVPLIFYIILQHQVTICCRS